MSSLSFRPKEVSGGSSDMGFSHRDVPTVSDMDQSQTYVSKDKCMSA